jgi:hypothetical protein
MRFNTLGIVVLVALALASLAATVVWGNGAMIDTVIWGS